MDDCISRQVAINAVQGIGRLATLPDNDDVVRMSAVEYVLFNLPSAQPYTDEEIQKMQGLEQAQLDKAYELGRQSAQPEPQWIPCSERLPHGSCSDLVNVSIHDDSGDTPFDYTSCGWVTTDGEYWIVDNEINNHVIAWMPLPEPYRGYVDEKI